MFSRASEKSLTDESRILSTSTLCTCFFNSYNVGMAQYELVHQFKEFGFPDIGFVQSTAQALYVSKSLYTDSSTLSNFTVFAVH